MDSLIKRLKVAIPLIVITVLAFFLPGIAGKLAFTALALGLVLPTVHEACTLLAIPGKTGYKPTLMAMLAVIIIAPLFCSECLPVPLLLFDFSVLFLGFLTGCFLLFHNGTSSEEVIHFSKFTLVEVLLCGCLAPLPNLFHYPENGPSLLFFLVLTTKLGDIGAYAVGSYTAKRPCGNHKLAPSISPQKSWEGLVGGVACSFLGALLCYAVAHNRLEPLNVWAAMLLGILAGTVGLVGDLVESAIKRSANAKDSGHVPGLGGVFDIFDSLLFMGPIFYAALLICSR
ncbi:MAG: phosphatidate cytidylyltransferase [Victivallales bacterium]|nr:phosphatidate cytidylyltransferase [Victivallales bacterium]